MNKHESHLSLFLEFKWRVTDAINPWHWVICYFSKSEQRKKQLDWLATNTDDITSQSHSLFACWREKNRQVEKLEFVLWKLEFVLWKPEFLFWKLEFVFWKLEFVFWKLEFVFWKLEFIFWYVTLVFNSFNLCRSSNSSLEVSKIMFSVFTINDANFKSFSCKRISAKVR